MRWDNLRIDQDGEELSHLPGFSEPATIRTFDAPEALGIRFHEVRARSAINKVPKRSRMPFRHTINPYRGCTHGCTACFARPTHAFLDFNSRDDFERQIVVKVNVPELVRAELRRPSWKGEHVALGTNTDPYQWVEGRYQLTRGVFEAMRDHANPCSVLTRSPLMLRDLDLFKDLRARTEFSAALSIPTVNLHAWRATEPHSPNPRKRIEAVAELTRNGIPTSVLVAPLIPGITDDPAEVESVVAACTEAGAVNITPIGLRLRGEVREIWFDWLREHRPDLLPRYEELYERGAYLPGDESNRLRSLVSGARGQSAGGRGRGLPRRKTVRDAAKGGRDRAGRDTGADASGEARQRQLF